jgi:uncharacterized membrane protein YhhN
VVAFSLLVALAGGAAVVDWWAVGRGDRRTEYVAKPAVLVLLTAAAAVLPAAHAVAGGRRGWFVAALVCCLAGDVLLMLPRDRFVPGLAAFLAGHLLYVVGFLHPDPGHGRTTGGLVAVATVVAAATVLPAAVIVRSLVRTGSRTLAGPVVLYVLAIAAMAVLALTSGSAPAAVGAVAFVVSDTVLAWNRFVRPLPAGAVTVHVTYHVAQVLLVLSLLR